MKNTLLYFSFLLSQTLFAQLPNTDIWLLDIKATKDTVILSNPVNITNRAGYDNQPSFSPDGKYILYTSIRDEKQSDIYKYDLKTKQVSQFTNTPATSEYSPTFMPDGKNISVVMVEPDSVQRLWKFPIKGGAPSLVMDKVDSIGYHCWITKDSLALVMITEPPSIHVVNTKTQKENAFADNAGRCLQKFPTQAGIGFFYMVKENKSDSLLKLHISNSKYRNTAAREPIVLGKEIQDYAIIWNVYQPVIIYGNKSSLTAIGYFSDWYAGSLKLSQYGIKNITRIAISPDGTKMAIVAE
ncbi:MAG: hypothetical protein JWO44_2060 [Bacteroidetes bacterium]|nr:hypothetical protein [Bacteroidota bacterium]